MAVIGLPFKTTNEELKEYFEKNYGELVYSEVSLCLVTSFVIFQITSDNNQNNNARVYVHIYTNENVCKLANQRKMVKFFLCFQ